jgi:hypothetical protein
MNSDRLKMKSGIEEVDESSAAPSSRETVPIRHTKTHDSKVFRCI